MRTVVKLEQAHWLDGFRWPPPLGFDQPTRTGMAISSDGRFVVYSAIAEKPGPQVKPELYLRRTDELGAKPIAGTEGGINPFLSPDDRWVGFWVGERLALDKPPVAGKLMKVPIDGGVPVPLCGSEWPFGASWGPDNNIVFSPGGWGTGIFRVSADGGKSEVLTTPDRVNEESSHRLPHWLPDGKGVIFTIMKEGTGLQSRVALLDLKTRKWSVLLKDAADARIVSTGHLVFLRQGTLMAVPLDLGRLQVTGQPVPAVANVMQALNIPAPFCDVAAGQFSVSDSGWLIYAPGGTMPDFETSLAWVDQKGSAQPITAVKGTFFVPRLSPDGQRIAYTTLGKEMNVWVYDLNRGTRSRLTSEGKAVFSIWTPDGTRLVFNWFKSVENNLYWQPADGSQPMERLATSENGLLPGSFSPDGTILAMLEGDRPGTSIGHIRLLDMRSRQVTPFLNPSTNELYPELSPDGQWMAYVSDETGRWEVYVRPFPGPGSKWQVSTEGGMEPLWAHDGKRLFYRSKALGPVWVVDVRTDGDFAAGKPRLLFEAPKFVGANPIRGWDISLDGEKFLMVKMEERKSQPVTEMILVQNWFEELKRLCPTGK